MDLFESKSAKPMLIGASGEAFDDPSYIYELKLDGVRCIAYLGDGKTELRNKRLLNVTGKYPELSKIHEQVSGRVVLDGEVFVMKDGKPFFAEMQRRSLMSDRMKISVAAGLLPVSFTAFDILYQDGVQLTGRPLMERKQILERCVLRESERFSVSRYIEAQGIALYQLTESQGLEGIVSKRKDSLYHMDTRTKDWIKCKNLLDDDFVVCGYIEKEGGILSVVLGQYEDEQMIYKGHVTLGVSREDWRTIRSLPRRNASPFEETPRSNEAAAWVDPSLVCTVKYMEPTTNGGMRQPVFKGLRADKKPEECII